MTRGWNMVMWCSALSLLQHDSAHFGGGRGWGGVGNSNIIIMQQYTECWARTREETEKGKYR